MGCDGYPRVESGMLVLKGESKGNGTREAEWDSICLTELVQKGGHQGCCTREVTMCETNTWCTSWESNPGVNNGNINSATSTMATTMSWH